MGLSCSVARSSKVPASPMAAVSVTELPEGEEWLYELKLDRSPDKTIVTST